MENDLKKIVGQRLQLLRLERNLTQEQMGDKLSLSTSAYCKIEYGETDLTLTRLTQIAGILNISAVELFSKICGNVYFNNCQHIGVGVAKDATTVNLGAEDDLRELVKTNGKLIDVLFKRIEELESQRNK